MYVDTLLKMIGVYEQLDIGCKKHRGYKAKRKSSLDCDRCHELYELREELNKLKESSGV